MSEQQNNNNKKPTENCKCTKNISSLEKAIKILKLEIDSQRKEIDIIKKVLKR